MAERKIKKLLPFGPKIKVIAPRATKGIKGLHQQGKLELTLRKVRLSDIKGSFMVIVAVDNIKLQKRIYQYCKKKGILCNSVDSIDYCSFIFPSLILKGDIVIGISTSGKVPALSRAIREYIERSLPENLESIKEILEGLRKSMPKGKKRQRILSLMALRLLNPRK